MKAKIKLNHVQIQQAIELWLESKNLRSAGSIRLDAVASRDFMDRPLGGYDISAEAEIELGDAEAHAK